MNISNLYIGN